MTTRPAALGLVLVDSEPFGANALDPALAGSNHWPIHDTRRQTLELWADVPFLFCWSDGSDPAGLPNNQDYPLPAFTAPGNTLVKVEFVPGMLYPGGGLITGFRMVFLSAGGTWYCNEWRAFT